MVPVDDVAEEPDAQHAIENRTVTEQGFADIGVEDVGHNAHRWNDGDINLGMTEKPEEVLPEELIRPSAEVACR